MDRDHEEKFRQITLALTDDDMGRVLEDLIEMLHRRALINREDLPAAALAKLERRAELRKQMRKANHGH